MTIKDLKGMRYVEKTFAKLKRTEIDLARHTKKYYGTSGNDIRNTDYRVNDNNDDNNNR